MHRVRRLQTGITLFLVALIGLGLLAFMDHQLVRADEADARQRRATAASQVMNRLIRETERERQTLWTAVAFVASSQQVTADEFKSFLIRSGVNGHVVTWLALISRGGGPSLYFPHGRPPPDLPAWPTPVGPLYHIVPLDETLRQVDVVDGTGHRFALLARLDFQAIERMAIGPGWQGAYDVHIAHWLRGQADGPALVETSRESILRAGAGLNQWQVTVRSKKPWTLLTRGRQLLWGVGLGAIALALVAVRLRMQSWAQLHRRVRDATASLARQNQFLSQLTTVISRPEADPRLAASLTGLLGAFMPVTRASLWLTERDGTLTSGPDDGSEHEPPPAIVVGAWLDRGGSEPGAHALPIGGDHVRTGVLDVRVTAPLSSPDRELLGLLADHLGHALTGRRLMRLIDAERRMAERILGNLSETVLVCRGDGIILYANPAADTLFDLGGTRLRGQCATTLPLTPNPCIGGAPPVSDGVAWLLRQSQRRPLRFNRAPLSEDLVVVTLRDVSAEESASTQKAEFIALASHELRTPLTIIRAQTQALSLADQLGLSPERRSHLHESVIQQVDRLTKLVHDLLDASRLAGASIVPVWQDADVAAALRQALRPLQGKARQQQIRVTTDVPPDLPLHRTDPLLLEGILANLIDNAINYSPPGSEVQIHVRPAPDGIAIHVADHGIGISAEDQQRLFQPFQRLQTPFFYRVRGTGLGLYLSNEWAKTLGGSLSVTSEPGIGSIFSLHLPGPAAREVTPAA